MLIMKSNNVQKHISTNQSDSGVGETLIRKIDPARLQMICEMKRGGEQKSNKEEICKYWKEMPQCFLDYKDVIPLEIVESKVLVRYWMGSILRDLYDIEKGQADCLADIYYLIAAIRIMEIFGIDMMDQETIEKAIHDVNAELGVSLTFNWWIGFVDQELRLTMEQMSSLGIPGSFK